jgi:hypothetical protein
LSEVRALLQAAYPYAWSMVATAAALEGALRSGLVRARGERPQAYAFASLERTFSEAATLSADELLNRVRIGPGGAASPMFRAQEVSFENVEVDEVTLLSYAKCYLAPASGASEAPPQPAPRRSQEPPLEAFLRHGADSLATPLQEPSPARAAPARLNAWYSERVATWRANEPAPTEAQDWAAAREQVGECSRAQIRDLRRALAPHGWLKPGPKRRRD